MGKAKRLFTLSLMVVTCMGMAASSGMRLANASEKKCRLKSGKDVIAEYSVSEKEQEYDEGIALTKGEKVKLSLDGANAVSWEFNDKRVASVSSNGTITAKHLGYTTLTLTFKSGKTTGRLHTVVLVQPDFGKEVKYGTVQNRPGFKINTAMNYQNKGYSLVAGTRPKGSNKYVATNFGEKEYFDFKAIGTGENGIALEVTLKEKDMSYKPGLTAPEVSVYPINIKTGKRGAKELTIGKDYSVSESKITGPGAETITVSGKGVYDECRTKVQYSVYPGKVSQFKAVNSEAGKVKLSWEKDDSDSYTIEVSKDKSFKKIYKQNFTKENKDTVKLEKGTYYFRIRGYKNTYSLFNSGDRFFLLAKKEKTERGIPEGAHPFVNGFDMLQGQLQLTKSTNNCISFGGDDDYAMYGLSSPMRVGPESITKVVVK